MEFSDLTVFHISMVILMIPDIKSCICLIIFNISDDKWLGLEGHLILRISWIRQKGLQLCWCHGVVLSFDSYLGVVLLCDSYLGFVLLFDSYLVVFPGVTTYWTVRVSPSPSKLRTRRTSWRMWLSRWPRTDSVLSVWPTRTIIPTLVRTT